MVVRRSQFYSDKKLLFPLDHLFLKLEGEKNKEKNNNDKQTNKIKLDL